MQLESIKLSLLNLGNHTSFLGKKVLTLWITSQTWVIGDAVECYRSAYLPMHRIAVMHVQYSLSETTRIHDLSTRKMHLIRGNRRTAVLTNRTICTLRESLLRPVSIRVLHVIVAVCRLFLSTRKMHLIK